MIFVTVGNMDPFDRLIKAMDEWAGRQEQPIEILAQVGKGTYRPKNFEFTPFLTPSQYKDAFQRADLVVSHAGTGSIITALETDKPMLIMPKLASLGEQRNEHQLATANRFRPSTLIQVAYDVEELYQRLSDVVASAEAKVVVQRQAWPPDASLISFIRDFVSVPEPATVNRTTSAAKQVSVSEGHS